MATATARTAGRPPLCINRIAAAFLGCIPGTAQYSDSTRHPDNEPLDGMLAFRPEASLIYLNSEYVLAAVYARLATVGMDEIRNVVCDLSASPMMDLAGVRMLRELSDKLRERGIGLAVANPHGRVRDLLRAEGLDANIHGISRGTAFGDALA
jgi:MFS superfamily sulfate permease-like transporter